MPKSNKELAVELYAAILNAAAIISARSDAAAVKVPTLESAVAEVENLAKLLANISAD